MKKACLAAPGNIWGTKAGAAGALAYVAVATGAGALTYTGVAIESWGFAYVAAATGAGAEGVAAGAAGADSAGPNAFSTIAVSKSSSMGLAFDSRAIC